MRRAATGALALVLAIGGCGILPAGHVKQTCVLREAVCANGVRFQGTAREYDPSQVDPCAMLCGPHGGARQCQQSCRANMF